MADSVADRREQADIEKVIKEGDGYRVVGRHGGHRAEFYVHAASLDSMTPKDAKSFMRRSITNIIKHQKEE